MKSIKTKFIITFSVVIMTVTLAISFIALTTGERSLKEAAENSLQLLAGEGAKIVESRMNEVITSLTLISKKSEIEDMAWEVDVAVLKEELVKTDFLDIGFVLPNGYTYYTDGTVRLMSDRAYIADALKGKSEISDVIISRVTRKPEIEVAVPVYKSGKVVGALVARMEAVALSEISNDIGYGEKGYAFMINKSGTIIAHPDSEMVINRVNPIEQSEKDPIDQSLAKALTKMLQLNYGIAEYKSGTSDLLAGYSMIEGTSWRIVITADQKEIMAAIPKMIHSIIIALILVLIGSLGVVLFLDSKLTRPLIKISKYSKRIGELDISKDVEEVYLKQKDEIGILSNAFQALTMSLRKIILELLESAGQVSDTAHMLTESTQQSAVASFDITRTIEEISKGAMEQARDIDAGQKCAALLEDKMELNHMHMHQLNSDTEQVRNIVGEGLVVIDKLIYLTKENDSAFQKIYNVIQEMKKSSEQIGEASRIISDIARETNLISLNASIEAARAGEAGRGFGVVAAEIQKMAEQSAGSTKVIDAVINKLHNKMIETVEGMNQMTFTSEEQHKSIEETIRKYHEISGAIKNSEKVVSELNNSEVEMEKANNEIKLMLQSLSSIAEQNAAGSQQAVSVMEEQTASAQIIADVTDKLTQLAFDLKDMVANFKVA